MQIRPSLETCTACQARCCRSVSVQIDTPTCKRDYDHLRWYLTHQNVQVYLDHRADWYLEFVTPCRSLTPDSTCAQYETRPRICRNYPDSTDTCEYDASSLPYVALFTTPEELEAYLDRQGKEWRWKGKADSPASTPESQN
jgi:uncharacterized protein